MKNIENIYFIAIGGIEMSALARYFIAEGKHVAGYDKTPSVITQDLQNLGADVHFDNDKKFNILNNIINYQLK